MPLIKRFSASDEYSRLLSTSRTHDKERESIPFPINTACASKPNLLTPTPPLPDENTNTEQGTPWQIALVPLLKETQATFRSLRLDPDSHFSQDNIFRFSAPFFTFACALASVATALRKDSDTSMMPSPIPRALSLAEMSLGVFVLLAGVFLALAVLRAIIWGGAVAVDAFLLVDIESFGVSASPENDRSKLNQRSILFSGLFS
ncbi:hypothetical protein DEU56DRAFT_536306 [Suillus clintonianus]|uniref:uncharacterized protein n=1 Tax=Suillus clintonianus TaxID=1904413 RepID=UPI001B87FD45|nr:uncharacterized protein DEU56DRAFT_536306 [Suillus clintonianus]KAG2126813.1 hypothetical protein DEU56DRAFT_536306 [Suillus clintonianus]